MFCYNCGNEMADHMRFCMKCGSPAHTESAPDAAGGKEAGEGAFEVVKTQGAPAKDRSPLANVRSIDDLRNVLISIGNAQGGDTVLVRSLWAQIQVIDAFNAPKTASNQVDLMIEQLNCAVSLSVDEDEKRALQMRASAIMSNVLFFMKAKQLLEEGEHTQDAKDLLREGCNLLAHSAAQLTTIAVTGGVAGVYIDIVRLANDMYSNSIGNTIFHIRQNAADDADGEGNAIVDGATTFAINAGTKVAAWFLKDWLGNVMYKYDIDDGGLASREVDGIAGYSANAAIAHHKASKSTQKGKISKAEKEYNEFIYLTVDKINKHSDLFGPSNQLAGLIHIHKQVLIERAMKGAKEPEMPVGSTLVKGFYGKWILIMFVLVVIVSIIAAIASAVGDTSAGWGILVLVLAVAIGTPIIVRHYDAKGIQEEEWAYDNACDAYDRYRNGLEAYYNNIAQMVSVTGSGGQPAKINKKQLRLYRDTMDEYEVLNEKRLRTVQSRNMWSRISSFGW